MNSRNDMTATEISNAIALLEVEIADFEQSCKTHSYVLASKAFMHGLLTGKINILLELAFITPDEWERFSTRLETASKLRED